MIFVCTLNGPLKDSRFLTANGCMMLGKNEYELFGPPLNCTHAKHTKVVVNSSRENPLANISQKLM